MDLSQTALPPSKSRVLFISYDGLTDPLGSSQILPYLRLIRKSGRSLHILSFEKGDRYVKYGKKMHTLLRELNIGWHPLRFSTRPRYLAKAWDLAKMYTNALWLTLILRIQVLHCRSYLAAQVGHFLKKWTGVSFLFDMRGFWPDDRVEAKLWRDSSLFDQLLHRYYKRVERQLLGEADHVVSLTRRACPTIKIWSGRNNLPITVIPCCADFDFFQPTPGGGALSRDKLNIPEGAFVLSYLGSLGTWYLLSEMLAFFGELLKHRLEARFLMITPKWGKSEEAQWSVAGLDLERYRLIVVSASPEEVPAMLEAADLSICFIQPGPSRQACFPTKIAESLALGIPVLCNTGIGDIEDFSHLACVIPRMDRAAYLEVIENLDEILKPRGTELRALSRASFGLEFAESSYNRVYDELETHSV